MDEIARHLPPWLLWSAGTVLCILLELVRGGGPFLLLGVGAACASAVGAVGAPLPAQAAGFVLGAAFALLLRAGLRAYYGRKGA